MRPSSLDLEKIGTTSDLVSQYDRDLRIILWNPACEKRFSISREQAIGKRLTELFPQVENDFRVVCLKRSANEGLSFFFSNMPYAHNNGFYTQVIQSLKINDQPAFTLNVIREHKEEFVRINKKNLLDGVLLKFVGQY